MSWCHYQPITLQGNCLWYIGYSKQSPASTGAIRSNAISPPLLNKRAVLQPSFECIFCMRFLFTSEKAPRFFFLSGMAINSPWEWNLAWFTAKFPPLPLLWIQTVGRAVNQIPQVAAAPGVVVHYPHKLQCHPHSQKHLVLPLSPPYGIW